VEISAGTRIQQSVELRLIGNATIPAKEPNKTLEPVCLTIGRETIGRLPRLGLCVASHDQPLSSQEIKRLRALNLSHLRVDIHFSRPHWKARFRRQVSECAEVGGRLEIALYLPGKPEPELRDLTSVLNLLKPAVGAWLLFDEKGNSASIEIVALARLALKDYASDALFGGGTDAFFAQLNRNRPLLDGLDISTYSINPQVHAFDNASLVENLPAQMSTLASARSFSRGKRLAISPVTLRMRFNPAATGPDPVLPPGSLPPQVDPRQMSLFGAAWTLGSIKFLAEGGAHSVTYYETTGWLGVMETDQGSLLPDKFPSTPSAVFPMYHIFADMGEYAGAEVLETSSTDPLTAVGMTLRSQGSMCVLVANFTACPQTVKFSGLQDRLRLRTLDEFTAEEAMTTPETYRTRPGQTVKASENELKIKLAPFAVAKISTDTTQGDEL
jgi:hypothetical protein